MSIDENTDHRILNLATTDALVRAGITAARQNNLSEKETLIRLVLLLADERKAMFDELVTIAISIPQRSDLNTKERCWEEP